MSLWLKTFLAIVSALAALLAQVSAEIAPPANSDNSGYPVVTATEPALQWIDSCGIVHSDSVPPGARLPWHCLTPEAPTP